MANVQEVADPMSKWRDLVGGFILAFGDIELMTFRLWREHLGAEPVPHNYKDRTGRVLASLRRQGAAYAEIVSCLEASLRVADKRNTIAHHPMQVQVFQHRLTGNVFMEHAITSEIGDDYITDEDLMRLRAEVESLANRLHTELHALSSTHRAG